MRKLIVAEHTSLDGVIGVGFPGDALTLSARARLNRGIRTSIPFDRQSSVDSDIGWLT